MDLAEFRQSFINDISAESLNTSEHPENVFINQAVDILKNDYKLLNEELEACYLSVLTGTRTFKSMHIDAASIDEIANTLNLMCASFNPSDMCNVTKEVLDREVQHMLNYVENVFKHYFDGADGSNPPNQLAFDILAKRDELYKIHLFYVTTDRLSKTIRSLDLPALNVGDYEFEVVLDVLDIEKIYTANKADFVKEDLIIKTEDFGVDGIPCIKADVDTEQYESYLAVVPGKFLSEIYKKYSSSLLESNVRSFLKFNGAVNKGIRGTILNEPPRFFVYNNGISTTASDVVLKDIPGKGLCLLEFKNLQIINGGQTTATLAATNIKNNVNLGGIFVQMKLTVIKNLDHDLVRNIAKYANSQNKVRTADLNSSHPFYVRIEEFSRKIFAPLASGQLIQERWFFERARGQYDQGMMQLTPAQRIKYKTINPKSKKFTLIDLAKYANAADMLPYSVSWGGEVNSARFHNKMAEQWDKNNMVFNDYYYKELIGKKILFDYIGKVISAQDWYIAKGAYRPQLIAYTFSKLVYCAHSIHKVVNFRKFWDNQSVGNELDVDIAAIGKKISDLIYDTSIVPGNIGTFCKKQQCWDLVQAIPYELTTDSYESLLGENQVKGELQAAVKEQSEINEISNEIEVFKKGSAYWKTMMEKGKSQKVLSVFDIKILGYVIMFCDGKYSQLTAKQLKTLGVIVKKLDENGIR